MVEINREINGELNLERLLPLLVQRAAALLGGHGGALFRDDEATQLLLLYASSNPVVPGGLRFKLGQGGLCMTFFANSHGLCLDSCPLLGCLAHRYQIPEHFTSLFALKHSNVTLLSTHLFMKAFEPICRPDQRGQGLRKIDRQVG